MFKHKLSAELQFTSTQKWGYMRFLSIVSILAMGDLGLVCPSQCSWITEISSLKSGTSIFQSSNLGSVSFVLQAMQPVGFPLVVAEAGSDSCKLPIKTTEEEDKEEEEAAVSPEITRDAAVVTVSSELSGVFCFFFTLKEEIKKDNFCGKDLAALARV